MAVGVRSCEAEQMSMKSYLLALDGSQESLFAAELAWQLASANQAKVLAQTVVDSQSLWQHVGKDSPGIIGSGPYLAAYEVIQKALTAVAETLLNAYEARARGHNIESDCVIDEGNMIDQIVKRAKEHLVVVIGHRRFHNAEQKKASKYWFQHYSLAEHLAYECPKPLLIVQEKCAPWKTARLVISNDTFDSSALTIFFEFANALKLAQEIFCVAPEELIGQFIAEVRACIPANQQVQVMCQDQGETDPTWDCATDVPKSTLLVVATKKTTEGRMTCADTDPGTFVHELRWPAVVILPEVRTRELAPAATKASSLSKKG